MLYPRIGRSVKSLTSSQAQAEKNNAKTRQTDSQTESIRYGAYFILSVLEEGDIKMNSGFY